MGRSQADDIPMSPRSRDQQGLERLAIFKVRGMMPICRRCQRACKVLRGSPGTAAKFSCFDVLESLQ